MNQVWLRRRNSFAILITIMTVAVTTLGCTAVLQNPSTGQTITCRSGGWAGFGLIGLPIAIIGNTVEASQYHDCINKAKQAGYTTEKQNETQEALERSEQAKRAEMEKTR